MKSFKQAVIGWIFPSVAFLSLALLTLAGGSSFAETTVGDDRVEAAESQVSPLADAVGTLRPRWVTPQRATTDAEPSDASPGSVAAASEASAREAEDAPAAAADVATAADDPSVDTGPIDWRDEARIVIHGNKETERLASLVAGLLQDLGADDIERRVVNVTNDQDHIRYFHAEDRAMANALAAELDDVFGSVGVLGLTRYRPSPMPGLLEIWLR